MNGGFQSVEGFTFEGFATALSFGELAGEGVTRTGGYRLENCTFRSGDLPIEFIGLSDEVSTIQNNQFINVTLPFVISGQTVHFLGNTNSTPDYAATLLGRPLNAGVLFPEFSAGRCENNVLEGNTVSGNTDGFILVDCRNNVIRGNTFIGQRVLAEGPGGDNGSLVWAIGPNVQGNLIEQNELRGSEGQGIIIEEGSNNRIAGNQFSDLPGLKLSATGFPGTAIFLGEPTTRNEVRGNEFKKVVNTIVDLGTRNRIGKGQGKVVTEVAAGAALGATSGALSRMLDHPKLRFLRDRIGK